MKNKDNWGIEFTETDNEVWHIDNEGYESKEEAIKDGIKMVVEDTEAGNKFRVGKIVECGMSRIDADRIIEDAQERLYNEVGEVAETYLEGINTEQQKELEESMNNVFYEWHKKHKLFPTCYKIEDEEHVTVS